MTWDEIFGLSSMAALPGWLILIAAPRRPWVLAIPGLILPAALALAYALIVMVHFSAAGGGFNSIAGVRTLFQSDPVLVAGWQHYLAYDLMIGTFVARRLDAADVARVLQVPILLFCFLLGPLGLILGLGLETLMRAHRRILPQEV